MHYKKFVKLFSEISNKRINEIEVILGNRNREKGKQIIRRMLQQMVDEGFSGQTIGEMLRKNRHILYGWYKKYNIRISKYTGFKKGVLLMTSNKKQHNVVQSKYKKINGSIQRAYYIYPTTTFAYFIGLILGDGHRDSRILLN